VANIRAVFYTDHLESAAQELTQRGGRLLHVFSDRVFVAMVDESCLHELQYASRQPLTPPTATEQMLVNAWRRLERSPTPLANREQSFDPPLNANSDRELAAQLRDGQTVLRAAGRVSEELHRVMRGVVAVGVMVVSGPTEDLEITAKECEEISSQVLEGADLLISGDLHSDLSFTYDVRQFTVNARNTPGSRDDKVFTFDMFGRTFLFWMNAAGWAAIREVMSRSFSAVTSVPAVAADGERWSAIWNPAYTVYMPFTIDAGQFFLNANTTSGTVSIRQIAVDTSTQAIDVHDPIWSRDDWNPDYTAYFPFTLAGNHYFFNANPTSGVVAIWQVVYDGAKQTMEVRGPVWSRDWTPHYTAYFPFTIAGNQYFFNATLSLVPSQSGRSCTTRRHSRLMSAALSGQPCVIRNTPPTSPLSLAAVSISSMPTPSPAPSRSGGSHTTRQRSRLRSGDQGGR
jgi:hypothetical protein